MAAIVGGTSGLGVGVGADSQAIKISRSAIKSKILNFIYRSVGDQRAGP